MLFDDLNDELNLLVLGKLPAILVAILIILGIAGLWALFPCAN